MAHSFSLAIGDASGMDAAAALVEDDSAIVAYEIFDPSSVDLPSVAEAKVEVVAIDTPEMEEAQEEVPDGLCVSSDPAEDDVGDEAAAAVVEQGAMGVITLREHRREDEVSLDRLRPRIKTCSLNVTRLPLAVEAVTAGPKLLERVLTKARRMREWR